jgi:chromosome segregation ATPase
MTFNRNTTYSSHLNDVDLERQIRVLQMENDAKDQEVDDFRRRLHLAKKENQRLRENSSSRQAQSPDTDRVAPQHDLYVLAPLIMP